MVDKDECDVLGRSPEECLLFLSQHDTKHFVYHLKITHNSRRGVLDSQWNRCAACSCGFSKPVRAVVDHCHLTGRVRGFLCDRCNRAIGFFKDSPELLQKAIEYLEKHSK
jgi:hypothetical protein